MKTIVEKIHYLRLWLVATMLSIAYSASAGEVYIDGIYYEIDMINYTAEVTYDNDKYVGDINIPSFVNYENNNYRVVKIGRFAFNKCSELKSVSIPNTVTSIAEYAFNNCDSLKSITLSESVSSISSEAFNGCIALEAVYCPNLEAWCNIDFSNINANPLSYGKKLFIDGSLVTELIIPESITKLKDYTFRNCTSIKSVVIPNTLTEIGSCAFDGCSSIETLNIPNSVEIIKTLAFRDCTSLTTISIGNSVKEIWSEAFKNCSNLRTVNISDLESWCNISFASDISNPLFYAHKLRLNGNSISPFIIPTTITNIGNYAFIGLHGLTELTIPSSVTSIGRNAFRDCINLKKILFSDSITTIDMFAFSGCYSLEELIIPSSTTSIGVGAFEDCSGIQTVFIPKSLKSIGADAFEGCININDVQIEDLSSWCNVNVGSNPLYYSQKLTIGADPIVDLVIPNSVTQINKNTFRDCAFLKSVKIPNSVTQIGDGAFCGCHGITELNLPNSITSIGEQAFFGCRGITQLRIPDSVTHIGDGAFSHCLLQVLSLGNSVSEIGNGAFSVHELKSIIIPRSVTTIGTAAFESANANQAPTNIYIYDLESWCNIRFLGEIFSWQAERNNLCSLTDGKITDLVIPESVTTIGAYTFSNFNISSVTIPKTVESVGNYAFKGCDSIKELSIPKTVNSIGHASFACNDSLQVYVEWDNPNDQSLSFASKPFSESILEKGTLYVPYESIDDYSQTSPWASFSNIKGNSLFTETKDIPNNQDITIYANGGKIMISGAIDSKVEVFGMNGVAVYCGSADDMPKLDSGIYIVRVGTIVKKVVIVQ